MLSKQSSRQVQSVRTAFELINELQTMGGGTLTELAHRLDLAKSTLHNYLGTLESMGYVVKYDGHYELGLRFLTHGMAAKGAIGTQEIVIDTLRTIASEVKYPTWWVCEDFGRGIFLDYALPGEMEPIYGRFGKRSYLHTHAPGKAILAELPTAELEEVLDYHGLPAQTTETISDENELVPELETIRDRGYAVSEGEAVLGVHSIGVSFQGPTNRANAIGVFGHSRDLAGNHTVKDISHRLLDTVTSLEKTLQTAEEQS